MCLKEQSAGIVHLSEAILVYYVVKTNLSIGYPTNLSIGYPIIYV